MNKASKIALGLIFVGFLVGILLALQPQDATKKKAALALNQPVPDFDLTDTDGKRWSLSALKGNVVIINFWATWCPPCRDELPSLSRMYDQYRTAEDVVIITVLYQDNARNADEYFTNSGFGMPILIDPSGTVASLFGITGLPETYFITKSGMLARHVIGPMNFDDPLSFEFVESLRKKTPETPETPKTDRSEG